MFKRMKYFLLLYFLFSLIVFQDVKAVEKIAINKNNDELLVMLNYNWWKNFKDPTLQNYILIGLMNNNDLKILNLKIEEYTQFVKYTFGAELPTISLGANYSNINKVPMFGNQDGFVMPLTMSYELDLFGKNRNKTQATKKQLEAYKLQLQSSYISYASTVGTMYFNLMKLNEIIKLYDELIDIKQSIVDNSYLKEDNGLLTVSRVGSDEKELKTMQNKKTELIKEKSTLLTQFAVLLGQNPVDAEKLEIKDYGFKNIDFDDIMFLNSDVIFNRPDVKAIELQLEKAKIDIKVARKEFLPSFNITGALLFNNIANGGFFSLANTIKGLIVGCSEPLFVGGKKKANLKMVESKYEQIFETYRKTTLQATKEVNDSLAIFNFDTKINEENYNKLVLEKASLNDYNLKYKNGLISKNDLLKLKQTFIMNKIEAISSAIQLNIDYIGLYKSTAGKL